MSFEEYMLRLALSLPLYLVLCGSLYYFWVFRPQRELERWTRFLLLLQPCREAFSSSTLRVQWKKALDDPNCSRDQRALGYQILHYVDEAALGEQGLEALLQEALLRKSFQMYYSAMIDLAPKPLPFIFGLPPKTTNDPSALPNAPQ